MYALYREGLSLSHGGFYSESLYAIEAQGTAVAADDATNILNLASFICGVTIQSQPDSLPLHDLKYKLFDLYERYGSGTVLLLHYPAVANLYFREHNLDFA